MFKRAHHAPLLVAFGLFVDTAIAEQVRNIAPPAYTEISPQTGYFTPQSGIFSSNFTYPLNRWVMLPRYLNTWSGASPTGMRSTYDGYPNTGFRPTPIGLETFQRSAEGGESAQSLFQLQGYKGGMLMLSWLSPPSIYSKHTVYQFAFDNCGARNEDSLCPPKTWTNRPRVFLHTTDPNNTQNGLAIQANITVQQWDKYAQTPVGQLAFTFILRDEYGKKLEYVIYIFHSGGYYGKDSNPSISHDGSHCFIESSVKKSGRPMFFTTIKPDSAGDFSSVTFPWISPFFRVYVTPKNLSNAIQTVNNTQGCQQLSTNIFNYEIESVAINQEVYSPNPADAWVMGSSFEALGLFELY